jgi:arginine-tRNA-protein transferase
LLILIISQVVPISYAKPPPSHLPTHYGSYHQLYRLDGQLIAIGVLDILPACVSSVYFIYDKSWEEFSFGKVAELPDFDIDINSLHILA